MDREHPDDHQRVRELLGREPRGGYQVAVRDGHGEPVVIANAPLLDDGTPMPTRYWLIGPEAVRRVGRIEADGGVRAAEIELDPARIADAHGRYAAERDALLPTDHDGPVPTGGVGGTRLGVKCLHAHYAWFLAGGDDPVGRWVADRLEREDRTLEVSIDAERVTASGGAGWSEVLAVAPRMLWSEGLGRRDPPDPVDLTNAIGTVDDVLADLVRRRPELGEIGELVLTGSLSRTLVRFELGSDEVPEEISIARDQLEDVFRTVALEPSRDRAHNPGLPAHDVEDVVGASCVVVATLRRFRLDAATARSVRRRDR